ncbi:hypothetical protein VTK73DRAFT_1438 [Phialemonium thermophilum]|uniref:Uncharacterized protein n=1 Tax=Phialemonium thermophilum TaxID=223376 RepID=A0ABR3X9M4_9PEZI
MSRSFASVSKLARSISSTSPAARPSKIVGSKSASRIARIQELRPDGLTMESQDATTRSIFTRTNSRPVPNPGRTVPLMQTFRTSAPAPAASAIPTVDCTVLPSTATLYATTEEPALRVPILPDTAAPDRVAGAHAPEAPDAPLAEPQIVVVAADPANVLPAALTEVEGMGIDGVELRFVHDPEPESPAGQGMVRDLWNGFMDDLFGEKPKHSV